MPRIIADKMRFYEGIEAFVESRGLMGAKTPEIAEHMEAPAHVVKHALEQMKKEGRLTRWRDGLAHSWVSVRLQNRTTADLQKPVVESAPEVAPIIPDLKIGIIESTGHLRLVWKGLSIEIGVLKE